MNGATAKAIRRDVRRAVGANAIGVIEASRQQIHHQILPNLNALHTRLEHVDDRLHALEARARCADQALIRCGRSQPPTWRGVLAWWMGA